WRFDHNPFGINHIWHPLDGAAFHAIARANHLGLGGAALSGFATSMTWEYLLEFRETISINDVLITPAAGIAAGEFFHWLGRYLHSAPSRGLGHDVARWALSPVHALEPPLDRRALGDLVTRDALGLSSDIWHRFEVGTGIALASPTGAASGDRRALGAVTATGRLAALPGYLAPVPMGRSFREGNLTELTV